MSESTRAKKSNGRGMKIDFDEDPGGVDEDGSSSPRTIKRKDFMDQMHQMVQAIGNEINLFRKDPRRYAEELMKLRPCYNGNVLTYPDSGIQLETMEGAAALEDCIQDLLNASPLPVLMHSQAVSRACQKHVIDLSENDFCSHIGTDGSTPEERLSRLGEHREQCGENIVFSMRSAKEMVYHMLIDDGSAERGHRANLLNMDFHFMGIAFGKHPSAETVTVVVLVDHFQPKKVSAFARMQHAAQVVSSSISAENPKQDPLAALKKWEKLLSELQPDYLAPHKGIEESVLRLSRPKHRDGKLRNFVAVPKFTIGMLDPKPNIDPAVVRAFIHRVDRDFDNLVAESEIAALCHQHMLGISPEVVSKMFDEVLAGRPTAQRQSRQVDWMELYAEVKTRKTWTPVVDVHVQSDRDKYELTVEVEALEQWCKEVCAEFGQHCGGLREAGADLERTPGAGGSGANTSRNRMAAERLRRLNTFLAAVVSQTNSTTATPLQRDIMVQKFLKRPSEDSEILTVNPRIFSSVVCMSRRRLWAYHSRKYRELWLRLFKAVGLDPTVPMTQMPMEHGIEAHMDEELDLQQTRANVARPDKVKYSGLPPGLETMRSRPEGERVEVRSLRPHDFYPSVAEKITLREDGLNFPDRPWEEQRGQIETLVNQCLTQDTSQGQGAEMAYTFDARRMFLQSLTKQQRASDEQRFLAGEKRAAREGAGGATSSTAGAGTRNRGAGAFTLSNPNGVSGHFRNSTGDVGKISYISPPLNGEHIDHTLGPALKEDTKLSRMTASEREQQFSCNFGNSLKDSFAMKIHASSSHVKTQEPFRPSRIEFRADNPPRHGKFGRQVFDAQVRQKPMSNPHGISELELGPAEELLWQQERVHEYLDRTVPPGQTRHFRQCLPPCETASKHVELSSREPVRHVMDGTAPPRTSRRNGLEKDMELFTRPLGSSQMDRLVDLAPQRTIRLPMSAR